MRVTVAGTVFFEEPGVDFQANPQSVIPLQLRLTEKGRVDEFRALLARGLNTWDQAPEWLVELDFALGEV